MSDFLNKILQITSSKPYIDYHNYHQGNIFGITKTSRWELMHSNFIAWALRPDSSHALGFFPLYQFIRAIGSVQDNADALARIGHLHDLLEDEEGRNKLLTPADWEVWNIYVQPYEPMEVNWDELYPIPPCEPDELVSLIREIHERGQYGDLIEEEEVLWKQYCMWNEEQSQKRIPFNRRSSADMILAAKRYEGAIRLGAPEIVVTEQGRCLAEEMVLYYFGKEEPIVWD